MNETIVYQVRSIDIYSNETVIHAYSTEAEAQAAIDTMRKRTGKRYMYVPVPNQPDQYWGINFPEPIAPPAPILKCHQKRITMETTLRKVRFPIFCGI